MDLAEEIGEKVVINEEVYLLLGKIPELHR